MILLLGNLCLSGIGERGFDLDYRPTAVGSKSGIVSTTYLHLFSAFGVIKHQRSVALLRVNRVGAPFSVARYGMIPHRLPRIEVIMAESLFLSGIRVGGGKYPGSYAQHGEKFLYSHCQTLFRM